MKTKRPFYLPSQLALSKFDALIVFVACVVQRLASDTVNVEVTGSNPVARPDAKWMVNLLGTGNAC